MSSLEKKSLFWDVDGKTLSSEKDWYFIIERILEFGDIDDIIWMESTFPRERIAEAIKKSRVISNRTRLYCRTIGYAP